MRWLATLHFCFILSLLSGCRSNNQCALVEAELRAREEEIYQVRDELERTSAFNEYLQRELRHQHEMGNGCARVPLVGRSNAFLVEKIVLGRQTGGYEKDGVPGDEMLQVVIEPRDGDGHAIKAPGTVEVLALQITKAGLKKPLSRWTVTPLQLRNKWRSGLLSTGYFLQFPWKNWPTTSNVRVVVSFAGIDGRRFETDKDVIVRVVPSAHQHHPITELPPVEVHIGDPVPVRPHVIESSPGTSKVPSGTRESPGMSKVPAGINLLPLPTPLPKKETAPEAPPVSTKKK